MNKKNWFRCFSFADDKYVAEAHPDNAVKPKRNNALIPVIAACACFAVMLLSLWLFIPYNTNLPDVSAYADSEYYALIQKLNEITFEPPTYKNNAEMLWAGLAEAIPDFNESGGEMNAGSSPDSMGSGGGYQEVTDNQVEGIIEADRIKRSNTHIYYLDEDVLRIFAIDKENTTELGSYTLYAGINRNYLKKWEFYLSDDCKTVTVITEYYEKTDKMSGRIVELTSLDVTDPANIVKKDEFIITGSYMSSRKANGCILLLTEFAMNKRDIDFDNESTYLPQIDEGNGAHSIAASGIVSPDKLSDTRYTVVVKLDESTLKLSGTAAYLSYSEDVYVSENYVFLTRVFADKKENEDGTVTRNSMTEISCLAYGEDSFEGIGNVTVRGYIKDKWSMDEYEGILRVFTTTNATTYREYREENHVGENLTTSILQTATGQSNASLYCIDLSSFEIIASVIDFAPPREEIQSVRFDKENAYVCTSIELSDPVFFFDLSDLENITYKDTGTIDGFSTSLINFGNGYLLGIGVGDGWSDFKVEVYEETENGVRSVSSYEIEYADYSTEYKSYYVDRENQLLGIGVKTYEGSRYLLLHFDEYQLVELLNIPLNGNPEYMRGVYIDGYMYMFGQGSFKVEKVFN